MISDCNSMTINFSDDTFSRQRMKPNRVNEFDTAITSA
jgi:hypothetical protein